MRGADGDETVFVALGALTLDAVVGRQERVEPTNEGRVTLEENRNAVNHARRVNAATEKSERIWPLSS